MNVIYGYDEELMIKLISFIRENDGENLTSLFKKFGAENGRSAGSVRNLYYAVAKRAREDVGFCEKYLGGKPFDTAKIDRFTPDGERELLKMILLEKARSRSTRSAVMKLSGGDGKTALRFQNKYRSTMKRNGGLFRDIGEEIERETGLSFATVRAVNPTTEYNIKRTKDEINKLVDKIAEKVRKENADLKLQVAKLTEENERLSLSLSAVNGKKAEFFVGLNKSEESVSP
ncbi:MAG: hypothetical protein MJ072_00955 [Clostridia bacterium]|nr:hypothetical protein [Clostridia bacterium]